MEYEKLVKDIDEVGEFGDREHARDAAQAVLSVLGEHLTAGAPQNLASQLPEDLAMALPPEGGAQSFDIDQFDRRVAEREGRGCSPASAHTHATAVMTTVLSSISPGEARKVAAQLPGEYADLLPATG